ncbi:MAG TPA: pitrilysin family protein [Thermoanaerobaculia bacterium]|nr:pitrilysin family protein [Thermoanaerobaculia bacterium]
MPRASRALASGLLAFLPLAAPILAQVERVEDLRYPPLPKFEIPAPERLTLANGLTVLLLADSELPLARATAYVATGTVDDPPGKVGLVAIGADLLRSGGAGARSAEELDDLLDTRATTIEAAALEDALTVRLDCLSADLPEMLGVFADVLRRPRFDQELLEVAKNSQAAEVARQNDSPQQILFRELGELVYGDASPYARQPGFASLAAVTRADLVGWHAATFHPNRIVLGFVGDFDRAALLARLDQVFGDWPQGPSWDRHRVDTLPAPPPGLHRVAQDQVNQSFLAMGYLGIRRDDPDYYAVELMNQVLSGTFASRLFSNVRTKKGLAYSVRGEVGGEFSYPGLTRFWMSTKAATTAAGLDALRAEIEGMVTSPPGEEEVQKAKASILNSFIFNSDTRTKVLNQQLAFAYYGYPTDWLERYQAGIEAVTPEQVLAAAKKYLRPKDLVILVVGPTQGLDRPLESYGPVTERDVTIAPPPGAAGDGEGRR